MRVAGSAERAPVHCTADGKALLAFQPEALIDQITRNGLPALTPNTITELKALHRDQICRDSVGICRDQILPRSTPAGMLLTTTRANADCAA
jgi:DNA-binding IclR family transcriptional regulator